MSVCFYAIKKNKSLMPTNQGCVYLIIQKNSNIVKYYYTLKYRLFLYLFSNVIYAYGKAKFQATIPSVSREISLKC